MTVHQHGDSWQAARITSLNDHFLRLRFGHPVLDSAAGTGVDARVVADVVRGVACANADFGGALTVAEITIAPDSGYIPEVYAERAYEIAAHVLEHGRLENHDGQEQT